jgi:hypothetical protein
MPAEPSPCVVFDIDGTVADCRHRQARVQGPVPDWEGFFAAAGDNAPLHQGVELALSWASVATLVWLTGRPERYRAQTTRWLQRHGLPTEHLLMRPDGDMRPAAHFKAERLGRLSEHATITLVVDDDDQVVATLRTAGWPVRQVRWMQG